MNTYSNNAHSSAADLLTCLDDILAWNACSGQGRPLYLPGMGTGSSRMGLSHQDSFDRTIALFRSRADEIQGKVDVVIWDGDRAKASIWGKVL